jgi:hypothetical protein
MKLNIETNLHHIFEFIQHKSVESRYLGKD